MKRNDLGVLLIHGWTGSSTMMKPLVEPCKTLNLPVRVPVLSGHEQPSSRALLGITWEQWIDDGKKALEDLLKEVNKAVVVGHSMGGMIALYLAGQHPDCIDSVITAGTPGRMVTPFGPGNSLHWLFHLAWRLIGTYKKNGLGFVDKESEKLDDSYRELPTWAINELFEFLDMQENYLPRVLVPLLIMQSKRDTSCLPCSAEILFDLVSTKEENKHVAWFEETDHAMFLDIERQTVIDATMQFISERIKINEMN